MRPILGFRPYHRLPGQNSQIGGYVRIGDNPLRTRTSDHDERISLSTEIYLQQQPVSLFTSQRNHRIYAHGPPAWNKRRDEGHC